MNLRREIFIRTISLLAALIVVCSLSIAGALVWLNRSLWLTHCEKEALFVSEQSERLVLWDDRVALRDLLDDLVRSREGHYRYAFIEKNDAPYVSTLVGGVPKKLLEIRHAGPGEATVAEYRDKKGGVFYDISTPVGVSDTCVHLGMDRRMVDDAVSGANHVIALLGGVIFLLCIYPAWLTAGGITHEVDRANSDLQRLNAELEDRVEQRSAELLKANEELESEIARRRKLENRQADFNAMMRHDMRNALSIIAANAELLHAECDGNLDENTAYMLKAIQENSRTLTVMVEDLAVMSKLDSEEFPLRLTDIGIPKLVIEACMGISGKASEKGQHIVRKVGDGLPRVRADHTFLRRALVNILTNAVNYTPNGGTVTIEAGQEPDGGMVVLSVSDTGPGIESAEREKVFDMYYRSTAARGVRGSGLGLAIVREVMDAHGGRVEIDDAPGGGSTFRLFIPLTPPPVKEQS